MVPGSGPLDYTELTQSSTLADKAGGGQSLRAYCQIVREGQLEIAAANESASCVRRSCLIRANQACLAPASSSGQRALSHVPARK